jgi:glyceraldehyde-3-phosphate dehydrogenase/erythrose-4-phosphate dehydrogenase
MVGGAGVVSPSSRVKICAGGLRASQSIVPTTTGKSIDKIFHSSKKLGSGIRVPVLDGSLTDITFNVKRGDH